MVRHLVPRPPIPPAPFLVAGLGRAGRAAAQALRRTVGPSMVRAWDADAGASMQRLRRALESEGIRTCLGPSLIRQEVGWARTIVKSPGIPFYAPVIQLALEEGCEVLDELELGWRLSRGPMLAVTGTNGKSTVSGLASAALAVAGHRVRLAGNTQFGPCLSAVSSESLDWIVCEVSSFQLEGCVHLRPELAVFTNLTPEHLDRHGTVERYGAIKRRLFVNDGRAASRAVIDIDGPFGRALADDVERCGGRVTRVGFSAAADYRVESATWNLRGAQICVRTPLGGVSLASALPGPYNARNIATALAIADLAGVDRGLSLPTLSAHAGPPGRFEHIDCGQRFEVIVDFAHTPDALDQLLRAVRAGMQPGGRLRLVFGLGRLPDAAMYEMGGLARRLSDQLILTTSGFRGLPRVPPLAAALAGARKVESDELEVVLDRRRAIELAVLSATDDDVIVIPGRGALPDMQNDRRGEAVTFDDREVAREILRAASA